MTEKEKLAHELTLLYLAHYDYSEHMAEGVFVGRYINAKNRIMAALPDTTEARG